jgi:hypothetical protein
VKSAGAESIFTQKVDLVSRAFYPAVDGSGLTSFLVFTTLNTHIEGWRTVHVQFQAAEDTAEDLTVTGSGTADDPWLLDYTYTNAETLAETVLYLTTGDGGSVTVPGLGGTVSDLVTVVAYGDDTDAMTATTAIAFTNVDSGKTGGITCTTKDKNWGSIGANFTLIESAEESAPEDKVTRVSDAFTYHYQAAQATGKFTDDVGPGVTLTAKDTMPGTLGHKVRYQAVNDDAFEVPAHTLTFDYTAGVLTTVTIVQKFKGDVTTATAVAEDLNDEDKPASYFVEAGAIAGTLAIGFVQGPTALTGGVDAPTVATAVTELTEDETSTAEFTTEAMDDDNYVTTVLMPYDGAASD